MSLKENFYANYRLSITRVEEDYIVVNDGSENHVGISEASKLLLLMSLKNPS